MSRGILRSVKRKLEEKRKRFLFWLTFIWLTKSKENLLPGHGDQTQHIHTEKRAFHSELTFAIAFWWMPSWYSFIWSWFTPNLSWAIINATIKIRKRTNKHPPRTTTESEWLAIIKIKIDVQIKSTAKTFKTVEKSRKRANLIMVQVAKLSHPRVPITKWSTEKPDSKWQTHSCTQKQ